MLNHSPITAINTGRQYSVRGQRIAFTALPDGRVMFCDVDRFITGITTIVWPGNYVNVQTCGMQSYDLGHYHSGTWDATKTYTSEELDELERKLEFAAKALL